MIKIGSDNPEIKDMMNELLNVKDGIVLTTPKINCDIDSFIDKLSGTTIQSNVFGFLNSKFYYRDHNDKKKICSLKSYKFEIQKTDCVSMNMYSRNTGWHLILKDADDKIHSLDLKNMNLNGHKNSIEKHLRRLKLNS